MARIAKAIKPIIIRFFVDQPKIIKKYIFIIFSMKKKKPCDGHDPILLKYESS
jgi:hypothetical protein